MRKAVALLLVGSSLLAWCGCHRPPRPNLLLVTFDTTRWDHVGYATGRRDLTPMLDAMAARGTWFADAITVAPLTLVAHTSIMTGLYPPHHGVRDNGVYSVPASDVTLAERLRDAGYATHAVVSAFVLDSQFGLDQGFAGYDDDLSGGPQHVMFMFKEIKAAQTAVKAVRWLERDRPRDRPFFLWVHFFDPHANYSPPPDVATLFPGDPYSGEIHYADRELGRILKSLDDAKELDRTLFVFAADHGDSLGEHGERTHGIFVYDSTLHVPMLLAGPGVPAGRRVDALARTVDLVPTILPLLGLPVPAGLDGGDLAPLWSGREGDDREAYLEALTPLLNFGWSPLRALRTADALVVAAPRPEAYDLARDPGENVNLSAGGGAAAAPFGELRVRLARYAAADPFEHGGQQPGAVAEETRRNLAALGYLSGGPPSTVAAERPDPKDRIEIWNRFEAAQSQIREGAYQEAADELAQVLADDPDNAMAMGSYGQALNRLGRKDEALAVYRRMIGLDSGRDTPYLAAARILQDQKRFADARELIDRVVAMQPRNPDGYTAMGDLLLEQQDFTAAEGWFRRAAAIDPNSMRAASGLGNCLNRAGRYQEAARVLRAAYDRDPTDVAVAYNLGVVAERLGEAKSALALYRHAVDLDADNSMAWNNLGSLLDRLGRHDEALRAVAKAHELDADNVEATYNLGSLLLHAGRAAAALPLLDQALAARPDLEAAKVARAQALSRLDRRPEALAAWRRLAPGHPMAWLEGCPHRAGERPPRRGQGRPRPRPRGGRPGRPPGRRPRPRPAHPPVVEPMVANAVAVPAEVRYQTRTRWSGGRNRVCWAFTPKASYQASRLRTVSAR